MHHDELFQALIPLVRHGGGVAVITNGTPLWMQDSVWSQALRRFLEQWLDTTITATCGTDAASQRRYRDSLSRGRGMTCMKPASSTPASWTWNSSSAVSLFAGQVRRAL